MTLSQILVLSAHMLDDGDLATACGGVVDASQQDKVNLLISCANQVNSILATDYVHIFKTKTISSTNGKISMSSIDSNGIVGICYVKQGGVDVDWEIVDGALSTVSGSVKIKYMSQPTTLSNLTDLVNDFPQLSARILAYGVTAEYLFIKGNIEDAESWNIRFKSAINGIQRSKNLVMHTRRWY